MNPAGLDVASYGMGVTIGDINNDGAHWKRLNSPLPSAYLAEGGCLSSHLARSDFNQ